VAALRTRAAVTLTITFGSSAFGVGAGFAEFEFLLLFVFVGSFLFVLAETDGFLSGVGVGPTVVSDPGALLIGGP
jgi:hypothetical protein